MKRILLLLALLAWGMTACSFWQAAGLLESPTPTVTPTASHTPTPTSTPTPTPTPTPEPGARIESGEQALFYGDWDAAREAFSLAFEQATRPEERAAALFGLGRSAYAARDYTATIQALTQLQRDFPDRPESADADFFLARAYLALDDPAQAAEHYRAYLKSGPAILQPYVLVWLGEALENAGDPTAAREVYARALTAWQQASAAPEASIQTQLQLALARTAADSGDVQAALNWYQQTYDTTTNGYVKAQVDLLSGRLLLNLGETDAAYTAFQDAVNNFPLSYDSYSALVALVNAGVPVNELSRGLVDYFAGQYALAVEAFNRYLRTAPPDHEGTAHYYKAQALRALGQYEDAVAEYQLLIDTHPSDDRFWDRAWEMEAYTLWADLQRYQDAINLLVQFVDQNPYHPRAAEFLFDAARISERGWALKQAARLWNRVADQYPESSYAFRARFLAGITQVRREDYAAALIAFQAAETAAQTPGDLAAARFWIGKTYQALGQPQEAATAWQLAASTDPTGYYSERARDLLLDRPPFSPPGSYHFPTDLSAERQVTEDWLRARFNLSPDADLRSPGDLAADPRFQRGLALWHLGLYDEARLEFEALRQAVQDDPVASYRLANALIQIGLYRSGIIAARQVLDLNDMDDAATLSAPPYFNYLRFGLYYRDLIIPVAQEYDFHPLFLFSVVRQESLFEGFVRSNRGARGLMQIVPQTAAAQVDELGWPPDYNPDDLYRPLVSLRLGTYYLDKWRDYFDGDLYAALAAYNAGPGNASVWKDIAPDDPDLYLEVIRFDETRRYIRQIYELFAIYRLLYGQSP